MKLIFKSTASLFRAMRVDLARRHKFAFERVGFIFCRAAEFDGGVMVLSESYQPVADDNYVEDDSVGARINGAAIRSALQTSLTTKTGIFHVHMHEHDGLPGPSRTDIEESKKFVPDFFNVSPSMPHGTIILSQDKAIGFCWLGQSTRPSMFERIVVSGAPLQLIDVRI